MTLALCRRAKEKCKQFVYVAGNSVILFSHLLFGKWSIVLDDDRE